MTIGGHLEHALALRAGSGGVDTRGAEWSTAWNQFRSHPLAGAGPERPLVLSTPNGTLVARFAHNEYLQVATDTGLVGLGALCLTVLTLSRMASRRTQHHAAATAALAAGAVGGLSDFSWHLPAVAMTLGLVAALTHGDSG